MTYTFACFNASVKYSLTLAFRSRISRLFASRMSGYFAICMEVLRRKKRSIFKYARISVKNSASLGSETITSFPCPDIMRSVPSSLPPSYQGVKMRTPIS